MDSPISDNEQNRCKTAVTSDLPHHKPSNSELMASAKVVSDAITHRGGENKFDKEEVAGAAANLLNAASHYGKLEDKSLGKLVGKAENYLNQYHSSHSTTTAAAASETTTHSADDHGHSGTTATAHSSANSEGDHQTHGSNYGEYIKMAEGVLKKHSGDSKPTDASSAANAHSTANSGAPEHGGHSGSDYGQYMKMAGDFLKKH